MKTLELTAYNRETVGKRNTKDLRGEDRVPGVVYTNGNAEHVYLDVIDLKPVIYTSDTYILHLNIDGKVTPAIVRGTDFHPVNEKLLHIEFLAVSDDKAVKVDLPLKMVGTPAGVTKGGKLAVILRKIRVKGVPSKLPEFMEVSVDGLDLGQTIKVQDVDFGDIQIETSPSAGIAAVEIPRALRSAASASSTTVGAGAAE